MAGSSIKAGAILSYLTTIVSLLLGLIYTPWMISVIGRDDYGLYTLAISLIGIFLMDFGLGTAVSRFLSMYYAKGEDDKASRFLGTVYELYLILAGMVAAVLITLYLFIDNIYMALDAGQMEVFKNLYIVVAFYSVVSVPFMAQNNVLIANERFVPLKVCTLLQKLVIVALTIVALIAGAGVFALVAVNAVGNILFIAIKAVIIRRNTRTRARFGKIEASTAKEFLSFTGWVTVSQVCGKCNYGLMPSVLGIVSSSSAIAVFGVASQLESYVYTVGDALGGLFMPKIARIVETGDCEKQLLTEMIKVGRIQVYIIGLIFTGFVSFGISFVSLWLGNGFEDVYLGTILLIAPSMISLPQTIGSVALTVINKVKQQAYASVVMALACIGLGFPLSTAFGALGACGAIAIGLLISRIMFNWFYIKYLRLDISRFFQLAYTRWFLCATALTLLALVFQHCFICTSWFMFFVETVFYCLVYVAICWFVCFNSYEKDLVRGLAVRLVSKWK